MCLCVGVGESMSGLKGLNYKLRTMWFALALLVKMPLIHTFTSPGKDFQNSILGMISAPSAPLLYFRNTAPTIKYTMSRTKNLKQKQTCCR